MGASGKNPRQVHFVKPWRKNGVGLPNVLIRSNLFGATQDRKEIVIGEEQAGAEQTGEEQTGEEQTVVEREWHDARELECVGKTKIVHTGPDLNQGDLEAFMALLRIGHLYEFGTVVSTRYSKFLDQHGLTDSGSNRAKTLMRLERLQETELVVRVDKKSTKLMLIDSVSVSKTSLDFILDPGMVQYLGPGHLTIITAETRYALRRWPLAGWLLCFYSTHRQPYPYKISTLHRLAGSRVESPYKFRQQLCSSLTRISEVLKYHRQTLEFRLEGELVKVWWVKDPGLGPS